MTELDGDIQFCRDMTKVVRVLLASALDVNARSLNYAYPRLILPCLEASDALDLFFWIKEENLFYVLTFCKESKGSLSSLCQWKHVGDMKMLIVIEVQKNLKGESDIHFFILK